MNTRPKKNESAEYFHKYINLVPDGPILKSLKKVHEQTQDFFKTVGEINGNFRYAPGKWTLKEVLIHLIDTEQIMAYRALAFARNEKTPLPGYDENAYVDAVDVSDRTVKNLMEEYKITRNFTLTMFKYFDPKVFDKVGVASGNKVSVRALAYIMAGHELHHLSVIKERYLG